MNDDLLEIMALERTLEGKEARCADLERQLAEAIDKAKSAKICEIQADSARVSPKKQLAEAQREAERLRTEIRGVGGWNDLCKGHERFIYDLKAQLEKARGIRESLETCIPASPIWWERWAALKAALSPEAKPAALAPKPAKEEVGSQTCIVCDRVCNEIEGTWPSPTQSDHDYTGPEGFVCYDCLAKEEKAAKPEPTDKERCLEYMNNHEEHERLKGKQV